MQNNGPELTNCESDLQVGLPPLTIDLGDFNDNQFVVGIPVGEGHLLPYTQYRFEITPYSDNGAVTSDTMSILASTKQDGKYCLYYSTLYPILLICY